MLLLIATVARAQNLETLGEQKKLTVNGGVAATTTLYDARGIANRRDPFYWLLSANLNLSILGIIQAPFSMSISQQQKTFTQPQPFNRFGITGHFGHRSMVFSEYTLGGQMFLGAGIEIKPENSAVRFSAMYGRLAKAVQRSAQEGLVFAEPTYQRIGYGFNLGLGRKKHLVDLIVFKAADDENSIEVNSDVTVLPEENLVAAIHSKHNFYDKLMVEFEYAYSLYTRDKRLQDTDDVNYSFVNNLGGLYRPNISSDFNKALTIQSTYQVSRYQLMLKLRDIDPEYRTMGSAFLNNGLRDITGGIAGSLLEQKLNLSANAGFQQTKEATSVARVIYAFNAGYTSNQKLSVTFSYSNFSTTTRQTQLQPDVLTDTLEFFQVTRNASLSTNYKLGSKEQGAMLVSSVNVQDAYDNNGNASTFYMISTGLQKKFINDWQAGLSVSYNQNNSNEMELQSIGPVASLNKSFWKGKLRSSLSFTALQSYTNATLQSRVDNISVANQVKLKKKHSISCTLHYLHNKAVGENARQFEEYRATINYGYSF